MQVLRIEETDFPHDYLLSLASRVDQAVQELHEHLFRLKIKHFLIEYLDIITINSNIFYYTCISYRSLITIDSNTWQSDDAYEKTQIRIDSEAILLN